MRPIKISFNARSLQYVLISLCILSTCGVAAAYIIAGDIVKAKTIETNHAQIDAEVAQDEITRLQKLHIYLENNREEIEKASEIVADSQLYQYQNQAIEDITAYAAQAGIPILGFDFTGTANSPSSNTNNPIPLKQTSIRVRIAPNIPYESFYRFITSIEENITKMQLTNVTISPNSSNSLYVDCQTIEVKVFLR
ncbi:MAG: hypothetical protein WBB39_03710 [Candidatus Saccharimonadales bacterium]